MFSFIAAEKANYPVSLMCRVLDVNRTSLHDWERRPPSDRALYDAFLLEKIKAIHAASDGTYGAPRVHAELRLEHGIAVGRKRVERLMARAGLQGIPVPRKARTTVRVAGVRLRARPGRARLQRAGAQPSVVRGHHLPAHLGGLALPGLGARLLLADDRRLVHALPHAPRAGQAGARDGRRPPAAGSRRDSPLRPRFAARVQGVLATPPSREELRWELDVGSQIEPVGRRCTRLVVRRWRVASSGSGSGRRSLVACPLWMQPARRECQRQLASDGFARVAGCQLSLRPRCRGVTCHSPNGRRSRFCVPAGMACERSHVRWAVHRRRSRRELRRNAATRSGKLEYRATTAQWHAERRAKRPKTAEARRQRGSAPVRPGPSRRRCGATGRQRRRGPRGALDRPASRPPHRPPLGQGVEP